MRRIIISLICLLGSYVSVNAADVEVVKSGAVKSTIDISGFRYSGSQAAVLFTKTLELDLKRSGWFTVVKSPVAAISLRGSCSDAGQDIKVECMVSNAGTGKSYLNKRYSDAGHSAARLAHKLADDIVMAVKGVKGISSTRIAMIGARAGKKDVYVCDADGGNFMQITKEGAVCLTPDWGPDGKKIVYTSFQGGFPDVYIMDLERNTRKKVAGFAGLNSGAEISPDGKSMVLTLSKDGNPDLYVMKLRNGSLTRLTRTGYAVEASPSWSPDGKRIVFVSDRSRSPQLYVVDRSGGTPKRISYNGSQNVSPDWGSDGRIVFSSKREGRYHICVIDPDSRREKQITREYVDHEDPSWAPDGRHVVYTRTQGYQSDLHILDTFELDDQVRLTRLQGQWHSPSWSNE